MKHVFLSAAASLVFLTSCAEGKVPENAIQSEQATFTITTVASGLSHPWGLEFLPGGDYLVTERGGALFRITPDGAKTQISGVPDVVDQGQGGLFEVILGPDFDQTGYVYISYAGAGSDGGVNTEVARGRLDLETNAISDLNVIFRAQPKPTRGNNHFGGRLLFGPDGKLYVTLGDRYHYMDQAQSTDNHLGTLVRLNPDGSVPEDNPFTGDDEGLDEIYTYGNRNIQGIAVQPGTDRIWMHEHGPKGGDEVNIVQKGVNYGWPEITYGVAYSGLPITDKTQAPGMEQPVIHWTPSIAPSGMAFYDGDRFPDWQGDIFVGALAKTHLRRLEVDGTKITDQEVLLKDMGARIRDVATGPDGYLYLLTDETDGRLLRLEPVN